VIEDVDWRKVVFVVDGAFFLILAVGFALRVSLATRLWPWIEQPICSYFLAALLAAYGAGCLYLARLGDWSAAAGGSIAMVVAFGGFASYVAVAEVTGHDTGLILPAAVLAVIATIAAATLAVKLKATPGSLRLPAPALRTMLRIMGPLLFLVGIALLAGAHAILPWSLSPQTLALLGWVLIGFSANYVYTSFQGGWSTAQVLLVGLFSYDVTMILPLLEHYATVAPEYRITLIINTVVILLTVSVAIFHLFLRRNPQGAPV